MTTKINQSCKFDIGDTVKCLDDKHWNETGQIKEISVTKDSKFINVHYCIQQPTGDIYFPFRKFWVHETALKKSETLDVKELTDRERKDYLIMLWESKEQMERDLNKLNKLIAEVSNGNI